MDYDEMFEVDYADDLDALHDLENEIESESKKQENEVLTEELLSLSSHKRSAPKDPEDLDLPPLIIDEGDVQEPPVKRLKNNLSQFSSISKNDLPTILDEDYDKIEERARIKRLEEHLCDEEMISRILKARENKANIEDSLRVHHSLIEVTKVLPFPPTHSNYISITSSDQKRVYIRIRSKTTNCELEQINDRIRIGGGLLTHTMEEMRRIIYDKRHKLSNSMSILEEEPATPMNTTLVRQLLNTSYNPDQSLEEHSEDVEEVNEVTKELWINKFSPKHFAHLLSDSGLNRSLLKWITLWDHCVFKKEVKKKIPDKSQSFSDKFKNWKNKYELDEELDDTGRPKMKVALLCGAPGLGKTTLAHIIAQHAGYHVVEMNASDDRTVDAFRKKLEETTQMMSVVNTDPRPNCLIIDEIDGAPQSSINYLMNFVNRSRKKDAIKKPKSRRGGNTEILKRPIICICNDLYSPALRVLRQQSFVLHFPPLSSTRLSNRLSTICDKEQVQWDMSSLLYLCDKSGNDVRTCINTIQFIQSKRKRLTLKTVEDLSIGHKDLQNSLFHVWKEIFQLPKHQKKIERDTMRARLHREEVQMNHTSSRAFHILDVVSSNGDYPKLLEGVYENFLRMKFKDSGLKSSSKIYDWLLFYDKLMHETQSRQEWVLQRYSPFIFAITHLTSACIAPPKINYPQLKSEMYLKEQKSKNIFTALYTDMQPATRTYMSRQAAALDVIPQLLKITTPNFRPVSKQLYNSIEKKQLESLVQTMFSYNLTYRREKTEDGIHLYVLEPNIEELCSIQNKESKNKPLSYTTKQLIAKELEIEKMRRNEQMITRRSCPLPFQNDSLSQTPTRKKKTKTSNHLQSLAKNSPLKKPVFAEKPVVDFFSRFIKINSASNDNKTENEEEKKDPGIGNSALYFKFNEGVSYAVRKTLYVKDFL